MHCPRSRQLEPIPALTPAGADAQTAHATHGYSRSATVPPSESTLNGPGLHSRLTQQTSAAYVIR